MHHGRVVKRTGDGIIIEFRSVVDAVRCAIELQTGMVERNAGLPLEKRIEFRVGVHLGDVVEESDGDLMGDGVNVAARLEGIAKPGGICLSEQAYWQVRSRLDLKVSDLGATQLKNIVEPVRIYSLEVGQPAEAKPAPAATIPVKPESATPAPRPGGWLLRWPALAVLAALLLLGVAGGWGMLGRRPVKPAEAAHLSIVVLPFTNLSGDPGQDYFADGVTENLTTDLSRLSGSFVIARNTAFTYKGKSVDAKEIGKELGVRYVLEGSVQRDQNQVRVNAQLIDAKSGGHIWAERFDKPLANLFSLQDEIVASLASQLDVELMANEARRAERTPNPDSMDLYFQGMSWFNKGRYAENMPEARGLFERALALDPGNLDALLGTAAVDLQVAAGYQTDDRPGRFAAVEATLTKVLSQSPNNALAHYLMCRVLVQSKRGAQGIAECERALALNPNLATAHAQIGLAKVFDGHPEETESHELELNPNYATGRFNLAATLVELGRIDEARAEAQTGLALNPGFTIRRYRDGAQSDNPVFLKRREQIIEDMRKAGVPEG